jgi:hypothetical protein
MLTGTLAPCQSGSVAGTVAGTVMSSNIHWYLSLKKQHAPRSCFERGRCTQAQALRAAPGSTQSRDLCGSSAKLPPAVPLEPDTWLQEWARIKQRQHASAMRDAPVKRYCRVVIALRDDTCGPTGSTESLVVRTGVSTLRRRQSPWCLLEPLRDPLILPRCGLPRNSGRSTHPAAACIAWLVCLRHGLPSHSVGACCAGWIERRAASTSCARRALQELVLRSAELARWSAWRVVPP